MRPTKEDMILLKEDFDAWVEDGGNDEIEFVRFLAIKKLLELFIDKYDELNDERLNMIMNKTLELINKDKELN